MRATADPYQLAASASNGRDQAAKAHYVQLANTILPCRCHADFFILHGSFKCRVFGCIQRYLWRARRDSN